MEALQAKVTIAWLDWGDPQQLRPKDMQKLLQVYADGQLLSSDSYTITEEGPADFYGMEAYSYLISGLPVYAQAEAAESEEVTEGEEAAEEAEAGTPISYVVKQDTSLLTAYQNLDPLMLAVLLNPDAESEEELVVTEEQAAAFLAMDGEWAVTPEDGSAPARAFVNFFADGVVLAETKKETDWETDASVQTQVVWFDAINDKAYTHDGELLPYISYTVDGEQYDLSLTWDAQAIDNGDGTFRAAYSYTYTQEDADRLGVTAGEKLVITDTGDNNLNRTLAAANLTSKRIDRTLTQGTNSETGEPEWTVTEEKTTVITWSPISIGFWNGTENGPDNSKYPTPNVSRYSRKEEKNPDGSVSYTMYPMQNLVIDIEFRAGIENAKDHPGWAKTLFEQTGISMNGKDVNGDPGFNFDENLTDFWDQLLETYGARRSDFTLTGPDSDGRYHYTILNVPVYDTDKKQITYTLDTREETLNVNAPGDWYFTIENDNKNVPGYGTDVSQGYNGGTVILTRTNTTEYRATKIWQDELTKEERQSTDWTLWRYAARQGDTFEMAAQVFMDADNKTITIVATDKNGDVTKTFVNTFNWTTSGETIEHFLIENLPKYNSDGYEYTYFAREANLDSSYVRHFGAYTDGEFQEESAEETANREKTGYRGINNGGAVANQKTQYIPISVTKEWVAARYQNDLSNIQVVVKLKARHVRPQGDDAKDSWHDVLDGNGNPRTLTLEGFTAYQLTQTRTMEVDQYCSEGHELEFMWEEVAIYELETDEAGNLLKDEDGNYNVKKEIYKEKKVIDGEEQDIFCLSINSKAVETDSFPHADEYFVSNSNSNDQLGDGQVITNTLEGTTEYFVKKTWDETLTAGPITISLKAYDSAGRDVTQELTDKGYALEKTLKEDTPLTIKDENNKDTAYGGNYESRDSQWVHLFEDLPKYDAEGNLYNYIIREYGTTINGTMPEYHYGNDVDDDTVDEKQSVLIHNAPVPGVVQYIDVRKVWLDDSVTAGRDDCKFAIYAGTYPNGRLLYGKNDDDSNGLLGDYVIVAEGSNWWRHVDVTVFAYCVNVSGTIHYLTYGQLQQNWETLTEYDEKGQQVNNQDNRQRPDVYLSLYQREYQYEDDGTPKRDKDGNHLYDIVKLPYKDYLWTQESDASNTEDYWTAGFDLPKYDDHGTEIIYYASIFTVVNYTGIDYIGAQFGEGEVKDIDSFLKDDNLLNQSEVVYDKITGKFVVTHKENSSITEFFPQGNKNGLPLLEADNTFVEQIREKVNVIGRKIWENIPTGFPTNELPGLTFNLYRFKMNHSGQFLDGEDKPVSDEPDLNTRPRKVENHVLKVYAADNTAMTGEPVATYQVELMARVERVQSPGVDYEFKMNWVGFNDLEGNPIIGEDNAKRWSKLGGLNEGAEAYGKPMAKYDANGNMYRYAVVETMPSDDTWENLGNAYENLCGSINGYYITNTFDTVNNVAPIRVSKDWNFPNLNLKDDETPKFPERTEFKLYRFYKTVDGFGTPPVPSYAEPEEVATTVLEGREASYNWAAGNESTVTFRNPGATQADKDTQWPIYAPNGNPYIYFVGETPLDGYEEAKLTLNSGGVFDDPTGEGWPDLKDPQYSWASPAFKLEDQTAEVQVGVENKYTGEDHVDLTGSKVWRDYGGVFGTRPNSLILYLYRSAKEVNEYVGKLTLTLGGNGLSPAWNHTSPGPKNESPATNVTGDIKVTTELSEDKKTWTYHITGLDGYHTYAVPYTYKVQEDITNLGDYTAENGGAATGKTDTERNTVTMGDLTNSLTTSLTVEKLWKAGDDKPPVKMPPVVVKLQISDDNGKTWQWADAYFVKYFKNNVDFTYEEFLKEYQVVFDKELTPGHWSTEFIHLPKGIFKGEAKTFQYRAREIKIDDLEVKWDADLKTIVSIGGKPYNGTGYLIITEDDQDGTITNAFRETQFSVTKIWEGDENNRYGTRGDVDDEDTTTWSVSFHIYRSYQGNNGTPEILKYPGSDVDFVVTVSGVNRDDNATATVNNLPAQAPNGETYKYFAVELNPNGTEVSRNPIGDYNGTYGVVYDDGKDANTTTVTNTMNPTQLTVTKNWVGDQTSFRPENLPLTLYRRIQGTTGEGTKVPNAPAASWNKGNGNTWTATYGPLPKKDPSGNVYEYYVTEQTKDGYERPLYGTDSGAAGSKPNGEYWEETITNTATQFTLDKVSETASTEKLNGVTLVFQSSDNQWTLTWERNADGEERYEIKKGQGSWSASGEKENGGFVTGPVQITGLPVGKTFILKSETPPKGYVMPKGTVSFKLKADGTLSIVSGANTYLTLGTDNLALTLADPETQITLKKLNQENTEITEGYTFKLHGIFHTENGDKEEDRTLAPDSKVKEVKDGELMVSTNASSPEYTYTLTETGAPDGYKLSNVTVKFYLDVNGTVHILEGQSVATANGSTVSFKDDPFTLTVRKQEENANRFPAGAEFELKEHETNKVLGKFTTGKNGSVTINSTATNPKLKVDGIYVLTETKAPDGYLLPEENARSKTFQIQDDGTALTGTIDASGSFTPGTDPETAMLTFTDKPIKITLKKINVETNEGLSGARFRLDRKTSDNPEKWTTVRSGVTTGKDGTVLLWDAANGPYVVQGGTYRLVETQAPAGYVTEGTTEFTVSGDGKTVTVTGEAPSDTITVTNRKTSFKIMKRDNELEKPLSGATLAIYEYDASDDTHKGKRIATWETDGMGHTLDGVPEGEYILCEEVTPEGFAQIPSLHFKLREGNQIQLIGASTTHFALGEPEQGSDVYTIYAIDKKVRGHVALTKVRASDQAPLKGVMFDLYQVVPDGEDLRIARNLETNEHGEWTSVGSERLFEESVDAGKKLSTGLPKGDYYFLEVAATEDTALDRQTKHSFTITTDGEVAHPDKTGTIVNQMFTANVKLKKLDEVSGANVSGATFTLTYAADSAVYSQEAVTNSSGEVTFQDLPKKGTYILEETMAPNGYDIAGVHGEDHKPFKAELILDDDDYKQTVVINRARVDAKKLTVLQGSITADGIPNPRLLGSVTLYKADGDEVSKALDGAEFTLYKKNEATNLWDRLKSFLTGGTYTVEGVLDGTALHEAGKLTITDLDWGTYRLVETKGADGYAAVDENGDPIEVEFTIDRDSNKNIALTSDGHSFYNYHTILVIQKQGTNGAALTGAEFKLEGTFVDETGKTVTGTKTLATDSKGQIVLEGVLIAGETYTLTETKAPSGYSLRTGSFRFRMEADGSTTVVRSASGYQLSKSEFFDNQIVVTDRRKSTTFKTGDSSDLTLWLSLTAASLTGLVTVLALSRKKKRNTKA